MLAWRTIRKVLILWVCLFYRGEVLRLYSLHFPQISFALSVSSSAVWDPNLTNPTRTSRFPPLRALLCGSSTSRILTPAHLGTFSVILLISGRRLAHIAPLGILIVALEVLQHPILVDVFVVALSSSSVAGRSCRRCGILEAGYYCRGLVSEESKWGM